MDDHYFACLDLNGRDCLVVGGGTVGHEKASGLLAAGARVTVVAPEISDEVAALPVELLRREYRASDLDGRRLVIAATSVEEVNRRVFADAEERNLFCNVADVPGALLVHPSGRAPARARSSSPSRRAARRLRSRRCSAISSRRRSARSTSRSRTSCAAGVRGRRRTSRRTRSAATTSASLVTEALG